MNIPKFDYAALKDKVNSLLTLTDEEFEFLSPFSTIESDDLLGESIPEKELLEGRKISGVAAENVYDSLLRKEVLKLEYIQLCFDYSIENVYLTPHGLLLVERYLSANTNKKEN